MSDTPFFRTIMGHRFIEATVPSLVCELERLNTNLEKLVEVLDRKVPQPDTSEAPAKEDSTP